MNLKPLLVATVLAFTAAAPVSAGLSDAHRQQQSQVHNYKAQCELIQRSAEYRENHTAYVIRNGIVWASSYGDCVAQGRLGAVEVGSTGETRKQWVVEDGRLILYVQIIESGSTARVVTARAVR